MIWWFSRECYTRSHFELDGETSQRRWYFVLRHGRVGHRQIFEAQQKKLLHYLFTMYQVSKKPGSDAGFFVSLFSVALGSEALSLHKQKLTGAYIRMRILKFITVMLCLGFVSPAWAIDSAPPSSPAVVTQSRVSEAPCGVGVGSKPCIGSQKKRSVVPECDPGDPTCPGDIDVYMRPAPTPLQVVTEPVSVPVALTSVPSTKAGPLCVGADAHTPYCHGYTAKFKPASVTPFALRR